MAGESSEARVFRSRLAHFLTECSKRVRGDQRKAFEEVAWIVSSWRPMDLYRIWKRSER